MKKNRSLHNNIVILIGIGVVIAVVIFGVLQSRPSDEVVVEKEYVRLQPARKNNMGSTTGSFSTQGDQLSQDVTVEGSEDTGL